jgi:two-component system, HptB-dependent secretion and biofilm response regulator
MKPIPLPASKSLRVLVAEDSDTARVILSALIQKMGHQVIQACDGIEALALYEERLPDIILTDVMMPGLDGFGLLREIRARKSRRWVPVVFLTALDGSEKAAAALNEGADDYLLKPVQVNVLQAKLNAFSRTLSLQEETERQREELAIYRENAETEKRFARRLMELLSNKSRLQDPLVAIFSRPAEHLSGDIVAAARTPSGHLHVLLADGTGHGLPAALNVLPTIEPFYSMTSKGFSAETILIELNRKLHLYLPTECYVAAAMVSFNPAESTLEVWNGGLPDVILVDQVDKTVRRFKSSGLPLGIIDANGFEASMTILRQTRNALLVLASDGLVEALGEANLEQGIQVISEMALEIEPSEQAADQLVQEVTLCDKSAIEDDFTLVAIRLPEAEDTSAQSTRYLGEQSSLQAYAPPLRTQWAMELTLGAQQLADTDVIPLLHGFVQSMGLAKSDSEQLFVVLAELFNNALDHGVLLLSSETKNVSEDLEAYFQLREERLKRLEQGEIAVGIRSVDDEGAAALEITVADSGPGFDPAVLRTHDHDLSRAGRGVHLVRSLCSRLEFRGTGNVAVARLRLSPRTGQG